MSMDNRWEKGNGWRETLEFEGIRRIGPVMFPRLDRTQTHGKPSESASPNSRQLRSFFISNRSSIDESEDVPSRSPGLEEDLGSCYLYQKGNVHQPYFELVSLSIQSLQQYTKRPLSFAERLIPGLSCST